MRFDRPLQVSQNEPTAPASSDFDFSFTVPRDQEWRIKSIQIETAGNSTITQVTLAGQNFAIASSELSSGVLDLEAKFGNEIRVTRNEVIGVRTNNPDAGTEDVTVTITGTK